MTLEGTSTGGDALYVRGWWGRTVEYLAGLFGASGETEASPAEGAAVAGIVPAGTAKSPPLVASLAWEREGPPLFGHDWPPTPATYQAPQGERAAAATLLRQVLADATQPVVCLHGLTGIGKSTLVVETLEDGEQLFGQEFCVWINCEQYRGRERKALGTFVSQYLLEAMPGLQPAGRTGAEAADVLPLETAARCPALLVMDNFEAMLDAQDCYQGDPWVWDLLRLRTRQAARRGGPGLKVLLISWRAPRDMDAQGNAVVRPLALDEGLSDAQMHDLLDAVWAGTIQGKALRRASGEQKAELVRLCGGNPAALNAALTALRLQEGIRSLEDLLALPFLQLVTDNQGREINLRRYVREVMRQARQNPERRAVLYALALLRLPTPADDAEDGVPSLANRVHALDGRVEAAADDGPAVGEGGEREPVTGENRKRRALTPRQVRQHLERLAPGFVRVHDSEGAGPITYSLSPLFASAVYEELREESAPVLARLMEATAQHYQSLLENLPDALRPEETGEPAGPSSMGARYRLETPEYRKYIAEWLRAMLGNPERDPQENRASLAAVVLKLHWWWATFVPWEVFDHVLSTIELGLRLAGHLQTDADFGEERRLVEKLREFDVHWPKESRWTVDPDPVECRRAREALLAVRRVLDCDYPVNEEGVSRPTLTGDLRAVAAITDMYLGDLWLFEFRFGSRQAAVVDQAALWMQSARRRYAGSAHDAAEKVQDEDLSWSEIYVIASQGYLEWERGDRLAALRFAREGLERCLAADRSAQDEADDADADDGGYEERDARAKVYVTLGEGLLKENPQLALDCFRLAHWEAFAYLWDPPTDPPNDDYTLTHYRITCERFIHALRCVFAESERPEMALAVARQTREFWLEWSRGDCHPCPAPRLDREGEVWENLLREWSPQERGWLTPDITPSDRARALTQQYQACAAALFPELPNAEDRAYRDAARAFTRTHFAEPFRLRDKLLDYVRCQLAEE